MHPGKDEVWWTRCALTRDQGQTLRLMYRLKDQRPHLLLAAHARLRKGIEVAEIENKSHRDLQNDERWCVLVGSARQAKRAITKETGS